MPLHLLLMVLSVFNFGYQKNKYLYMLLQPKKTKYKKNKKGSIPKLSFNATKLNFGTIGFKAIESGIITARQIEAARQAINRKIKQVENTYASKISSIQAKINGKKYEIRDAERDKQILEEEAKRVAAMKTGH